MLRWIKRLITKYDAWCNALGLTPENKRSCVPYRSDPPKERQVEQSKAK